MKKIWYKLILLLAKLGCLVMLLGCDKKQNIDVWPVGTQVKPFEADNSPIPWTVVKSYPHHYEDRIDFVEYDMTDANGKRVHSYSMYLRRY